MLKIMFIYIYIYIYYNNLRLILCLCLCPSNKMHFYPFCSKKLTKRKTNNFYISPLTHKSLSESSCILQ